MLLQLIKRTQQVLDNPINVHQNYSVLEMLTLDLQEYKETYPSKTEEIDIMLNQLTDDNIYALTQAAFKELETWNPKNYHNAPSCHCDNNSVKEYMFYLANMYSENEDFEDLLNDQVNDYNYVSSQLTSYATYTY